MKTAQVFSNEETIIQIRTRGDSDGCLKMRLWEKNSGIIRKACKRYAGYIEEEDAMQECYFAFTDAANEYDPDSGTTFARFCFDRCRWHLFRYIENCGSAIRIPPHAKQLISKYKKFVRQWVVVHEENPSDSVICFNLNITQDKLDRLRIDMSLMDVRSLDAPLTDEEESLKTVDTVPDQAVNVEEDALESQFTQERKRAVWGAVDTLRPQDAEAIRMHYKHGLTYTEAGEAAGVTGDAIRRRIASGVRQLRTGKQKKILREFIDLSPTYSMGIKSGLSSFSHTWTSSTERTALKNISIEQERHAEIEQLLALKRELLEAMQKQD